MSIPINSVIQIEGKGACRVIWKHGNQQGVALIDIRAKNALPELITRKELVEWLAARKARLIDDPYAKPLLADDHLTKAERERYQRAWEITRELLEQAPYIFDARRRGTRLREVSERTGLSTRTLLKWLRRAWQRGPVPQSLVPDFRRCGGKGQSRISEEEHAGSSEGSNAKPTVKRGCPRRRGRGTGINITTMIRKWMRQAWSRTRKSFHLGGLEDAYLWLLLTYFPDHVKVEPGPRRTKVKILHHDKVPTREQFRYHFNKENNRVAVRLARYGQRTFEKLFRPLLSNSLREVRGPGSRYQIDATILDLYVVSRFDGNFIVGRPTVYVVIDVLSRLVVGVHIGLEAPCWVAAMMALISAAEDKVEFAARHGVALKPGEWPSAELPLHLLGDRGELESSMADALSLAFGIDVENAPPYRPDWKGAVERHFGLLHAKFKSYTPGYVEPDFRERGAEDYRQNAVLTLDDLWPIIINCINATNHSVREEYEGDPEIVAAGVPYVPVELWQWGKEHLRSDGRRFDPDYVRLHLLPHAHVTVCRRGLRFLKGLYYANASMMAQPWYFRAQQNKLKLEASYHPGDITTILVVDPDDRTRYYTCELTPHSQKFAGKSLAEVDALRRRQRDNAYLYEETTGKAYRIEAYDHNCRIIEHAKARKAAEHDPNLSAAQRVANMRETRAQEKVYHQAQQAADLGLGAPALPAPDPATVVEDLDHDTDTALLARLRERHQKGE